MKKYVLYGVLALCLVLGLAAGVAMGGNPHGTPPGQGDCSHGATGKDCKPDPNPDHGKDCEEHGKHGGVNEDHCTPTGTTPTDTIPTGTTPTDTVPTTPTETTPTTSTPTETTPGMRCPPGEGPFAGKDGQPGNDECCPDSDNNQQCDQPQAPPAQAKPETPAAGGTSTTLQATKSAAAKPAAKQKNPNVVVTKTKDSTGKPVIVKKNTKTGVVQVKRPGGTYVTATQGSG